MVGVDGSRAGHTALEWAATRAAGFHVPLNLVRVVPGPWSFRHASRYLEAMNQGAELLAEEARKVSALHPAIAVTTTLRTGETTRTLRALSKDADMIVLGKDRRPDRGGGGFGSVSFQTATISNCVETVVPPAGADGRAGVVVGTDGSADSAVAVERAATEALHLRQELTVLHACDGHDAPSTTGSDDRAAGNPTGACVVLSAAVAGVAHNHPDLNVHAVIETRRSPAEALVRAGARALLLVIGCKGRAGLNVLVGSVARDVLMDAPCPTLITRAVPPHDPPSSEQPAHTKHSGHMVSHSEHQVPDSD